MPNMRVVLFQIFIALIAAIVLPTLAILFWQKVLVPLAKVLKWKKDDDETQIRAAEEILKAKTKK